MYQSSQPTPRLIRSRQDRVIAGVAGGIAQYLAVDPVIIRLGFVALLFAGFGLLLYPVLWVIMPEEGSTRANPEQAFDQMRQRAEQAGEHVWQVMHGEARSVNYNPDADQTPNSEVEIPINNMGSDSPSEQPRPRNQQFGIILIGIGAMLLLSMLLGPMFGKILFPALLVVGGLLLLRRS